RKQAGFLRYSAPLPDDQRQWQFWSALYAMVYRWFDSEMAADELRSATSKQPDSGPDVGLIRRSIGWNEQPPDSDLAAPPLLAVATVAVYHLTGDWNLIERVYPRLAAAHTWFDRQRDQDGDGLVEPAAMEETLRGNLSLPGDGQVTERDWLELNYLRLADLDALAHIAYDLRLKDEQQVWEARAETVRQALMPLSRESDTPLSLFARCAMPEQAEAVAASVQSAGPWGPPCVSPSGQPCVSLIHNWLVYVGLRNYDLRPAANALAERSLLLVERSGYHALYHAETGEGMGAAPATVAALAVDMLFRERQTIAPGAHCI